MDTVDLPFEFDVDAGISRNSDDRVRRELSGPSAGRRLPPHAKHTGDDKVRHLNHLRFSGGARWQLH